MDALYWQPGDQIVVRDVRNGVVRAALPVTVVADAPERVIYYLADGATFYNGAVARYTPDYDINGNDLKPDTFRDYAYLDIRRPADGFAIRAVWRGGVFSYWRVNLESALARTRLGFDSLDYFLDMIIAPDLVTWAWKDEDEFALAVANGWFSDSEATAIRAEGLRAVDMARRGAPPFNEGWERWHPDPSWPIPVLPDGWDVA